jgi:peptidoglycan/xylan/chitin deacetylase (PgdA/CDA1 family)
VLSLLSVVVTAREADRFLVDTLAHAGAQTHAETEILVVDGGGWPDRVRHLLEGAGGSRPVRYVAAPGGSPGAMRNAGVRASIGSYVTCVDCGELLEPRYGAMATAALHADPRLGFVGANEAEADPFVTVTPNVDPTPIDLATALRDPFALPGALTVRRDAWAAVGGFDEALDGLETYDLCLRLLARGYQGLRGAEALVRRAGRQGGGGRWRLDPDQYARTVRAILGRHEVALGQHAQAALYELERGFRDLLGHHRRLVQRRDDLVAERTALQREAGRLTEALRATGETGFDWGDLRRTHPVSQNWGYERGQPLDRYYIGRFLAACADDVRGRVLEIQEADLTARFGGDCVTSSDVLDVDPSNPKATVVADLRRAPVLASDSYDCVILTQTIHVIDDMRAVLAECVRILRPGGVLLATLPAASRVCLEYGPAGDFWRVTEAGARALFSGAFPPDRLDVRGYGNVLANVAFLEGLAVHELTPTELDVYDPYFPLIVGVRAVKPSVHVDDRGPESPSVAHRVGVGRGASADAAVILLYHQVRERALDVHRLAVAPAAFRAQMAWLQRHCSVMALPELAESVRTRTIPPGAVAVTLDDGYADNFEVASPILVELGIPATFFVTLGPVNGPLEFWWDTLEGILLGGEPIPPALEMELEGRDVVLATRTADERHAAHAAAYRALAASTAEARDAVVHRLLKWAGLPVQARPDCRRLAPSDLVRLAGRPGHAIGAHGVQHLRLPLHPSEVQRAEIEEGRTALSRLLGQPVTAFAYPFGDYADTTVALIRDAGYAFGLTTEARAARPGDDLLRLPRIELGQAPLDELAARLQSTLGVATG